MEKYDEEKMKEWLELNTLDVEKLVDIINGYNGYIHTNDGKVISYSQIRDMFETESEV
jgi:hypothetical protein